MTTAASFHIGYTQYLGPDGDPVQPLPTPLPLTPSSQSYKDFVRESAERKTRATNT